MYCVVAALLALAAAQSPPNNLISKWADFKQTYGNSYTQEEEPFRFRVFQENLLEAAHLQKENPLATFGVNAFSAMTQDEFRARQGHKGALAEGSWDDVPPIYSSKELRDIPASLDWRQKGAVTPIKDQGQCGSCWAFSTTGNIEGVWAAAGHPLTSLSEQELISCIAVTPPGGQCHGGLASISFDWLMKNRNGDLITEAKDPYASHDFWSPPCTQVCHGIQPPGTDDWCSNSCYQLTPLCPAADCNCTSDHKNIGATISSWKKLPADEEQLRKQLASTGPIAIAVDSMGSWQGYSGGIVTNCDAGMIDHGVLLVGYGTESGTDYWIIKNSWGDGWGEKGYMRVKFGTNQCNLKSQATTAIVTPAARVVV